MLDGPRLAPASGDEADALVVLLHGYGSNGDDLMTLAPLIQPLLPNAAFVAPNAPSRIAELAEGYQWWPIRGFSPGELAAGAIAAAPAIDAFLTSELARLHLADDRLLLIGFSQGTMMALHVGPRRERPIAGIIGFSGMLVAPALLAHEVRIRPPILLVHGTADDVVPFRSMADAHATLTALDFNVDIHVSKGSGHTVGPDGLAAASAFARRVLDIGGASGVTR
jgi:phospholipase/carboxylesterase